MKKKAHEKQKTDNRLIDSSMQTFSMIHTCKPINIKTFTDKIPT